MVAFFTPRSWENPDQSWVCQSFVCLNLFLWEGLRRNSCIAWVDGGRPFYSKYANRIRPNSFLVLFFFRGGGGGMLRILHVTWGGCVCQAPVPKRRRFEIRISMLPQLAGDYWKPAWLHKPRASQEKHNLGITEDFFNVHDLTNNFFFPVYTVKYVHKKTCLI